MKRIGIITGLQSEANCFADTAVASNAEIRVAAAVSAKAMADAQELITRGCDALVSFGIAGGLDPALGAGHLIFASEIVTLEGTRYRTDVGARETLHQLISQDTPVSHLPMFGSDKVIMSPGHKSDLFHETGTVAVDMESHSVAKVAADAGIPFLVVRSISDNALSRIPKSIFGALAPDGSRRPGRVILNLMKRPTDLPGLLRLQRGSAAAHRRLRGVASAGGPLLGFG